MILVGASVLIGFLRTKDAKIDGLLRSLPVAVCGVTRAEIFAGARTSKERQKIVTFLLPFRRVPIADTTWDHVGENLAALYAKGISVPFPDAILATVAIEDASEVWARDPHFSLMQTILPALRLFQEPP